MVLREIDTPMGPGLTLICQVLIVKLLIEIEVLDAIKRDYKIQLLPEETRRNITTQGFLNHLVNKRFWLGRVLLEGARLNVPCMYLERVTGKGL